MADDEQIVTGSVALHELFQRRARDLLERSDLDEEQKQAALVALTCPCCGTGGMNYTAKINSKR